MDERSEGDDECGKRSLRDNKKRERVNPWMIGRKNELNALNERVSEVIERRNEVLVMVDARRRLRARVNDRVGERLANDLEEVREELKRARKSVKRFCRRVENEWWNERIEECREACETGRIGNMYKCLRKIGTKGMKGGVSGAMITVSEFREHFMRVSRDRYEEPPSVIEAAIREVNDLRMDEKAMEANEMMNETPAREEIEEAMKEMRESAPGEDGIRIGFVREACEEVREAVCSMVQRMFEVRADGWDWLLKVGLMVPLFKKGDRNDRNNYRGVCLLAMGSGSRILGRVVAKRLGWWAEHLGLLD